MQSPSPPSDQYLHSFTENWSAVLQKIYPDKPSHVVSRHVAQLESVSGDPRTLAGGDTVPDFNVVILQISQLYAVIVDHFCRSDGTRAKNNGQADQFREQGTRMLNQAGGGELVGVAEVLNRSLAYAEVGGSVMYRGFELRSVVCYNLGEFRLCLKNIENGLGCGEGRNLYKIMMLKNFCMGQVEGQQDQDERVEATLSYEANKVIPKVVGGIELEVNEGYGRHLVAKQNFDFGDVLMMDDPYVLVADLAHQYRQCHHCLKFCTLELLPCPGCVEVMFCSNRCAKIAQQRYHRFECPILQGLYAVDKIGRIAIIVARIVFTAITTFNDDLDALREHLHRRDKNLHPFKLDWTKIFPKQRYEAIYSLATNKGIRDSETNNSFAIVAIFTAELMLSKSPLMATLANTQTKQDLIRELVYIHAIAAGTNFRITNRDNSLGAYPLASMINHGCVANVMRVSLPEGRIAIVATRPIAPGEQIFEDYTSTLTDDATQPERHHFLRWAYQIDSCRCSLPIVDEATAVWEQAIVRALDDLRSVELKQCDRGDLLVLMERFPTWMRMLEPAFAGLDTVRERFVQVARHLYEAVFNGRPEEERYGRKEEAQG